MSDPAKHVEIEDVLSSIRRLVSEEGRAGARSEVAAVAPKPGKLVLTPALRVAEATEPDTSETAPEPDPVSEPEGRAPWTDPDATLFSAAAAAGERPVAVETEEASEQEPAPEPIVLAPEDLVDETDGGENHHLTEWDAEADEMMPEAFEDEEAVEDAVEDEEAVSDPGADLDADGPIEDSLTARIEVLETMISQVDEDWEPDGLSTDAYSGTSGAAMAWQDHEPQAQGDASASRINPEPEEEVLSDDPSVLSSDEAFLDEESLRELVADIVREELQGALGERITRNVRKLVRREIHRALTAQELD
ncbi:hypothetical protein KBY28_08545 [Ruegeria pomeroyi]|uniref:hypothetical protein n=1 Tax=Ruegeria pomeroyi TaxID=89184 RepID=UPI001F3326DB|nr:hypothetical protein [Ruegeria pomeroyi]MCE8508493.1 hypothetical protein [Ruegeria pomeroyi]